MKKLTNLIALLVTASTLFSCELFNSLTEEEKTEQQIQAELFEGSWSVASMEVNTSGSVIDVFPDFRITFSINEELLGGSLSVSGDLVPNTEARLIGTGSFSEWSFVGTSLNDLHISGTSGNFDNLSVDINSSGTSLTLTFDYEKPEDRMKGLIGTYTVELDKE